MPLEIPRSAALTTFTIKLNGQPMNGTFGVLALEVSQSVGRIPYAHIVLQDGDTATQTFPISEADDFVPGAEITLDLGYDRDETLVFKGIVTRHRIEAPQGGASRLHIEAKHACFRMAHARKSRVWVETTDADALGDLAAVQGLSFDGSSTATRPQLVQHQASDWDFAVTRAENIGQVLLADDSGLRMFTPDPAAPPVKPLEYGINLFAFNLELDAEQQPASIETGAWTAGDAAITLAEAEGDAVPGPGNLSGGDLGDVSTLKPRPRHPGARDQAELDDWARAAVLRRRLAAVSGSVEIQGTGEIIPGQTVELKGMGARFNGTAFVSGLRHSVTRGDWRTILQIGIDPRLHHEVHDISAPPAAGLMPAITGLQIGTIDALQGDPAGEERVSVLIATETESAEPVWARPMSIGGGADRGLVMLPEIGDEVLLGFLDGDPRDPIMLGGLHSSAAASPFPGADENHQKGIASRKGMKITFDDDPVTMVLETPNGNKITLSDADGGIIAEDENGNLIKTGSGGIEMSSPKDIKISATGDVKIEGVNIKIAAQAEVAAEGSAGAKLESSGQTSVKGSVVMIN
ncbi:MAG: type VI secretion system tip protein VgrG [Rhodobacter sp.]|nr:type VI secretion system tip protein VgrG [Rhodobacter sp.]